jgi:hypothetical protein
MAKKAQKKPAAKKKRKPFRREDIPNISPQLGDMADPFLAAEQLGVDACLSSNLMRPGGRIRAALEQIFPHCD